eukprot:scpid97054/ scgid23510/ 
MVTITTTTTTTTSIITTTTTTVGPTPDVQVKQVKEPRTTPTRASSLGKNWRSGNIIILTNMNSKKSLKLKDGRVDGTGGQGKFAQFVVEKVGNNRVKLKSVANGGYLRLKANKLDEGGGGPFCVFYVVKHGKKGGRPVFSLESERSPGQHVGIQNSGVQKPPSKTGTGGAGSYYLTIHKQC